MSQLRKPEDPFEDLLVDEEGSVKTKNPIFKKSKKERIKEAKRRVAQAKK